MKAENTNKCSIRNIFTIYLVFFCLLRVLLAARYGYAVMWGDEISYWQISQSLFEEGKTIIRNMPVDLFSCLYPWSISWTHVLSNYDTQYMAAYVTNAVMMSSFLIPFYMLCCRILKSDKWALILTVITSIIPEFSYTARILTENLFFPIAMWTFYCAYQTFKDEQISFRKIILLGVLSFLCFSTRTAGICIFLALFTFLLYNIIFIRERKRNALLLLCCVASFFVPYVVLQGIYRTINSEIISDSIYYLSFMHAFDIHNFLYWFQGGARYLLIFVVITGFFSLVLPVAIFRKLEKQDRHFLVFTLAVLAWGIIESVGMYYINEGMERIHIRYISYLIPIALVLYAKSCILLKQHNEKLTKRQVILLCVHCILGLGVAGVCGIFINAGSTIDAVSASHLTPNHSILAKMPWINLFKLITVVSIVLMVIAIFVFLLRRYYNWALIVTLIYFGLVQGGNSILSYMQASEIKQNYLAEDIEYKQIDEYISNFTEKNAKISFLNESYWATPIEIHLSARNLSAIPLDQCIPLIDKQTATLKNNLIPYVGLLVQSQMGAIPDYIIMKKSLFEEIGIASYKQVFETNHYLVLKKEEELFRFALPTFSYTVEGATGDNWITGEKAVFHLVSDTALDKVMIYLNYLPGTTLGIIDDMGNKKVYDLEECQGVVEYIVTGEAQKDLEIKLYGEVTQKPMIVLSDSTDPRDLCANIVDVSIVGK